MTETTPNNPAARFMASLSVTSGANAGQQYAIRGPVTIGRAADNYLVLPDPDASRYHARIEAQDDGLWLTDLGSANGTRVNGAAVTPSIPAPRSARPSRPAAASDRSPAKAKVGVHHGEWHRRPNA